MAPRPDDPLRVERSDEGFATIAFNRPDKLNTLSIALRQALAAAVDALEADPAIHVLILTGEGRAFTAGLDLDEWSAAPAAGAWEHSAVAAIERFSGPVIGAVNGLCITGGLEIALACDVLVAAVDARFADTHAKVGLLPGWGGSVRLQQRVGAHRAKELALTGRFFSAPEALAWGLVNHVVPADQLQAEAQALARQMLANPPAGLRAYKKLLDDEARLPLAEALAFEARTAKALNLGVSRDEIDRRLAGLRRQSTPR
ncbi:MAG: enoyl-CoA hydratase [Proteobacteria bacterium]|nr:enoyl-CoA hydratase [Pseudomonadota bacterium]